MSWSATTMRSPDPTQKRKAAQRTDEYGALAQTRRRDASTVPKHVGMPSRSQIRPNSNGPPMRLAATDNDPSLSSLSVVMSNTCSVNLAPEASSDARAQRTQ